MKTLTGSVRIGLVLSLGLIAAQSAQAQRLSGEEAIRALQQGGYVLVMNQAPASLEAARSNRGGGGGFGGGGRRGGGAAPEPTDEALEQQSIEMLTGMRHAIWVFDIPVGSIYAGSARATRQHADEIPFTAIMSLDELDGEAAGSGWLTDKLGEPAMAGTNSIIVTHADNIESALGLGNVPAGETLIVRPGDNPEIVSRLGLREWSRLAIELTDQ
jgi:hypothetical protein